MTVLNWHFIKRLTSFAITACILCVVIAHDITRVWAITELRSAKAVSTEQGDSYFKSTLTEGYHFNDKAPNAIKFDGHLVRPAHLEKRKILFNLPKTSWNSAQAALYVCDDAVTFCETHYFQIKGKTFKNTTASVDPNKEHVYRQTLEKAKSQKKPLFLEFSARWCPGCVRYEKEVFSSKEFKKKEKEILFLKVDVDLFENFQLVEKFKVQGIPSIVAIDADEKEIDRLVDFQPIEKLKSFIESASTNPVAAVDLAAQLKEASPTERLKAGKRLLAVGLFDESVTVLSGLQPAPPELLSAKINAFQGKFEKNSQLKEEYIKELRAAIAEDPDSHRAILWRTELIKLFDAKAKERQAILQEGLRKADVLLKDPKKLQASFYDGEAGEFKDFEKMLIVAEIADLLESAGAPAQDVQKAYDQAVSVGEDYKIEPSQQGPALRFLIFLASAKQYTKAEQWADQILKLNPKNLDVLRRKMKILIGLQKYAEAQKIGEQIIVDSEGRNQFWVAESLAKVYLAQQKNQEAKRLIQAYLARSEITFENMKSTRKSLQDLLSGIK